MRNSSEEPVSVRVAAAPDGKEPSTNEPPPVLLPAITCSSFVRIAGSKTGGGSFVLGSLPSGAAATLTDTGSSLELRITSASLQSLTWSGGDGTWKTSGSANWNGGASVYLEYGASGDIVNFDDSVGGTVTIPSVVKPASITVNNSFSPYVFSGAGGLVGQPHSTSGVEHAAA